MKKGTSLERWTSAKSAELYGIYNWGAGYVNVSEEGDLLIYPHGRERSDCISVPEIVAGLKQRGTEMPVLLRMSDILRAQIEHLYDGFASAIERSGYRGVYRGVYPIKVNQQQEVVEEITRFGKAHHHGLEAGSKAELIAAISYLQDPEALLICNGYKDEEFIDLGLHALKMGIQCIFVLEIPGELPLLIERARLHGVRPLIGARVKLSSQGSGYWAESGGDRSTFGLTVSQLVGVVDVLREADMLDCFRLLHFHQGSQITNIRDIRTAVSEACRVYAGLVKEGAAMGLMDLGGGLAVDYDGSHTNFKSSRNYNLDEYCVDVIEVIMQILDDEGVEHPTIVTESGRATVAHSSVLLFNVLDAARFSSAQLPETLPVDSIEQIECLWETLKSINSKNFQECYHDAVYYRDEIRQRFKHGDVSLRDRAFSEQIFWSIMLQVSQMLTKLKYVPDEFEGLDNALADIYYGNFSVFQSLPDAWAINQLFPIVPIRRLDEKPTRHAIIADITCDSDGKIDRFVDLHDVKKTLLLHDVAEDEEYILAVFLVGAYQETLGDLHNLLGDTNVVSVTLNEDNEMEFSRQVEGDSVSDVLSYVEYDVKAMMTRVRDMAERAVRQGKISVKERRQIVDVYQAGLRGYTYFEQ
ncbi:MAG: biosynthetic arginine decarboxylase [Spartobacteria bacterium]|nr:biosynthetic arginine decarboxylase [Spartobacteria bacterium]